MSALLRTSQLSLLHIEPRSSPKTTVGHISQRANAGQTSTNEPVDKACSHFTTSTLNIVANTSLIGLLLSSYALQIRAMIVDKTVNGLSREAFILDIWWTTSQLFMTIASHIDPMPVLHCIASRHMSVFQAWGALLGVVQTVVVWLCSIITSVLLACLIRDILILCIGCTSWRRHTSTTMSKRLSGRRAGLFTLFSYSGM